VGVVQQQPAAAPVEAAPAPAPAAAPAAPPGPAIVQPSSDASHLNNPKPVYPAVSKRLGEQGKIVLRVLIGTDGLPQKIEIKQSSGYERLDRQAVDTVSRWRFVPGTRNGVPEAMWYLQPINFVLQQ
jgi:protein TonB